MTGWGTPPQIALYLGRSLKTVRNWGNVGAVPMACRMSDHALVIHAESARRHAETTTQRNRGLRRTA